MCLHSIGFSYLRQSSAPARPSVGRSHPHPGACQVPREFRQSSRTKELCYRQSHLAGRTFLGICFNESVSKRWRALHEPMRIPQIVWKCGIPEWDEQVVSKVPDAVPISEEVKESENSFEASS